jgi:hypothetical protein
MTVLLKLPPEVEADMLAQAEAEAEGVPMVKYLRG